MTPEPLAEENERLRARVAELERQLGQQAAAANAAIAAAQDRAYWLDRARGTRAARALVALRNALRR
jgi:cell division septum initiation protein DivIVA